MQLKLDALFLLFFCQLRISHIPTQALPHLGVLSEVRLLIVATEEKKRVKQFEPRATKANT